MVATFATRVIQAVGVDAVPEQVRKSNEGLPPVVETLLAETIRMWYPEQI